MNRDPLVTLPPSLTAPAAPAAGDRSATSSASTAAPRRRSPPCSTSASAPCTSATRVPPTKTPSAPASRSRRSSTPPIRRSPRAGIAHAQLAAAVVAVAGTDTASIDRNLHDTRSDHWIVVNDVVSAWATATGARPGVGAISGTGSNVFGVGRGRAHLARRRLGAPARRRGLGLLARRAVDRRRAARPRRLRTAHRAQRRGAAVLRLPLRRGARRERLHHAPDQGRSGGIRRGDRAPGARGRRARARALRARRRAPRRADPRRHRQHRAQRRLPRRADRQRLPRRRGVRRTAHRGHPRLRPAGPRVPGREAPVRGSLLLGLRACGCEQALPRQELEGLVEGALAG